MRIFVVVVIVFGIIWNRLQLTCYSNEGIPHGKWTDAYVAKSGGVNAAITS